ncbi:MAG: T9SS type A sorting domain-containing protein [Bacteroidales bacterium]|nr:T9SS type A sorting domain-containing protein [Bacteroidales bacterium]
MRGGGISLYYSSVDNSDIILNSILFNENNNNFTVSGAGVYCDASGVQNSLLLNNTNSRGDIFNNSFSIDGTYNYNAFSDSLNYNYLIDRWKNPVENPTTITSTWIVLLNNSFVKSPSAGIDNAWGTADDDYGDLRLRSNSIAINAGDSEISTFYSSQPDFYSNTRLLENRIDIGATETIFKEIIAFSLKGQVHADAYALTGAKVYAYISSNLNVIADSCLVNTDGVFEFDSLKPASYILKAVPNALAANYEPTFFGDEITAKKAFTIVVNDSFYDIDIHIKSQTTNIGNNSELKQTLMFPTVANDLVSFTNSEIIDKIIIFNNAGNVVATYSGNLNQISVSHLPSGVYIVNIFTNSISERHILIKK